MILAIAAVLLVLWLLGVLAFHVTAFAIHLLLIAAVIAVIAHFVVGGDPVAPGSDPRPRGLPGIVRPGHPDGDGRHRMPACRRTGRTAVGEEVA